MQDSSIDGYDGFDGHPSRLLRLRRAASTAIGAAVALSLLLAVGVWFYRLGQRDAGNVPIIRASAEPAKTRPEDPGGAVAPHQEITSYRVAEPRPAQASAAVIAPPPPEPKREDVAMGRLAPVAAEQPAPPGATPAVPLPRSPEPGAPTAADAIVTDAPDGTELALAATGTAPAIQAAVADMPVPPRRPADLLARVEAAALSAEKNAGALARRAADSAVQVQLAADPDESTIRTLWQRIAQSNADLLREKELAVQTTVSGGTKFYRLRVGPFSGASEARAVCQALKARGQDCIVARNG